MRLATLRTVDRPVSYTYDAASPSARVEPVTVAMAKKALRFTSSSEDDLILGYIQAARQVFEELTNRAAVDEVREYAMDGTPIDGAIEIPRAPLKSVSSISYTDDTGDHTYDAANYRALPSFIASEDANPSAIDPCCPRGHVELVAGSSWPGTTGKARCFRIRYVAGYGTTPTAMPGLLQGLVYLLVGHYHRNRAEVQGPAVAQIPLGASRMIWAFQVSAMPTCVPRGYVSDDLDYLGAYPTWP